MPNTTTRVRIFVRDGQVYLFDSRAIRFGERHVERITGGQLAVITHFKHFKEHAHHVCPRTGWRYRLNELH